MICKKQLLVIGISLLGIFHLNAQIAPNNASRIHCSSADTLNIEQIRNQIHGKTMGEKLESLLFWSQSEKVERFPIMQKIFPSIRVAVSAKTSPLEQGKTIQPNWLDDTTLATYLRLNHIAGVIVLKNDRIRLEAYGNGITKNTLWTSFSMAKSVSSMLLGIALKEGDITSLADPLQQYIPSLKGYDYGKVSIRQLLTMTSGIAWDEDYADPQSDVAQMYLQPCQGNESHILSYMKTLKFDHKPGEYWNYSTGETDLLGILIQKATGKSLAEYLTEKIWKPWGMKHCAYWLADECSGLNIGGSGLSATLRDYARLGTVMLHQGKRKGENLFADQWIDKASTSLYQTNNQGGGYGYLWWHFKEGSYAAVGIFGQMIYINPDKKLVIVQTAAWPKATSKKLVQTRRDFIEAVERAIN